MALVDNLALLLGRLLLAALYLPSGIRKAQDIAGLTANIASKDLPFPSTLAILAVIVEIAGPIALILGIASRATALALIAFTVVATLAFHPYWMMDASVQAAQQIQFFKNVAVIGGLLLYFASGPGTLSLERTVTRSH